jgi:hypothetical protein
MQSVSWYLRRLQGMSIAEVAWRIQSELRTVTDRGRIALGLLPKAPATDESSSPPFRVSDVAVGEWASPGASEAERIWRERLLQRAEAIARHRLSFFDLDERHLGDPIDWNRDHKSGRPSPLVFAASIDYRDFRVTGDAKFVWEPSRHHQLVVLGRAYRASGDPRFAAALVEQLGSWLDQSPFGRGMNWRSPLELAIRLINWVFALDLVDESRLLTGAFRTRVLDAAFLHLWDITRKYSRGSSANNHRIGEAAGVYVATAYFPGLDPSGAMRRESRQILIEEIAAQTYPDGVNREHAVGYHVFVLQFFLVAGIVGRRIGEEFPREYWSAVERMFDFLAALHEGGDSLPMLGDADDGYVLDLADARGLVRGLLSIGGGLFGRGDLKDGGAGETEPVRWLLGREGLARLEATPVPADHVLQARAFPDSGHYLLQCGRYGTRERISVTFDCGSLGFGAIAAHGHADALSLTLRAFGADVLVDPGTYDYFTFPAWREYFRSTRAHNTVVIDGLDQSTMLGPFLWGRRAEARRLRWEPATGGGGVVSGEHDGYAQLKAPVVHRRTVELDAAARTLTIGDELEGLGPHEVAVYFHLAEGCSVARDGENRWRIEVAGGLMTLVLDPALSVQEEVARESPISGWVSRGYHRKVPATTLVGRCRLERTLTLVCRVEVGPPA